MKESAMVIVSVYAAETIQKLSRDREVCSILDDDD